MAYGGKNLVTPDGKLHTDDPVVREAAIKAIAKLTTPFKGVRGSRGAIFASYCRKKPNNPLISRDSSWTTPSMFS